MSHSHQPNEFAAYPLPQVPIIRPSNKLANLKRLDSLSAKLDFIVPEAKVLTGNHFELALATARGNVETNLLIETLSQSETRRINQQLLVLPLPDETLRSLERAYRSFEERYKFPQLCVRSLFDLEDLLGHSFAGTFETVEAVDSLETLERAVQVVFASVFTERAIEEMRNAGLTEIPPMSVGIQLMIGGAGWCGGVAHTQSPELWPFPLMLFSVSSNSATVTSGGSIPEDYLIHRGLLAEPGRRATIQVQAGSQTSQSGFSFSDEQMRRHANTLIEVEDEFESPLELEWFIDPSQQLYLLQARPIPLDTTGVVSPTTSDSSVPLCSGLPVGSGRIEGVVRRVETLSEAMHVPPGHIIVTDKTDPDWVSVVRSAAGLVTAIGSRTSHVSRTAREASVLAVVACGDNIELLTSGMSVSIVCAEGIHGAVYEGSVPSSVLTTSTDDAYLNSTASAFSIARSTQPKRVFFDLTNVIGALRLPDRTESADILSDRLKRRIAGYSTIESFVENKLLEATALVSSAFPESEINVSINGESPWADLLPRVVSRCTQEYGFSANSVDYRSCVLASPLR